MLREAKVRNAMADALASTCVNEQRFVEISIEAFTIESIMVSTCAPPPGSALCGAPLRT